MKQGAGVRAWPGSLSWLEGFTVGPIRKDLAQQGRSAQWPAAHLPSPSSWESELADLCFLSLGKGDLIGCELPRREQVVKANRDVKGLTYCVLQCLQLAGLHESLALYPEFAPRFSRGLRGELSYNLGAGGGSAEVRVLVMCVERLGCQGDGEVGRGWGWGKHSLV
jgi:hypothetical protein